MNPYRHVEWVKFRNDVIKLHGGRCARCSRSREDGAVLQVHHKGYAPGRMPWEYGHTECEALCKGCHAEEHGKIMPQSGWVWLATDDLGDILYNCELCGQDIRYVYAITHPNWGSMAVGTDCCDRLTGTTEASEYHDRYTKTIDMRKRFVGSKRWNTLSNGDLHIRQKGIEVSIRASGEKFVILMDDALGKVEYDTILDAKIRTFDSIHSGEAAKFLARRREREAQRLREAMTRRRGAKVANRFVTQRAIEQLRRLGP
jgi:hypothetical protein